MKVWLNGALVEEDEARISPADRGFLLGDGVFETLRSYAGKPFGLPEHLGRLADGGRVLGIALPPLDELERGTHELLAASGLEDARLRITVTSGPGPAGLVREGEQPTRLITAVELRPWPAAATAVICPWPHDERSPLAGVKSTSRAASVMALAYARARRADEAISLNRNGNLCEATTANVFVVREGRVETPPLSAGCLPGITRELLLRLCGELEIEAYESDVPLPALEGAEEVFFSSSTRGVQPLVELAGHAIGAGVPGPVSQRLRAELDAHARRTLGL